VHPKTYVCSNESVPVSNFDSATVITVNRISCNHSYTLTTHWIKRETKRNENVIKTKFHINPWQGDNYKRRKVSLNRLPTAVYHHRDLATQADLWTSRCQLRPHFCQTVHCLWSVMLFFTPVSRSDHTTICLQKACLFFLLPMLYETCICLLCILREQIHFQYTCYHCVLLNNLCEEQCSFFFSPSKKDSCDISPL
jgi:hypothetical protein